MGWNEDVIAEHQSNVMLNEPGRMSAGPNAEFGSYVNCFFACGPAVGGRTAALETVCQAKIPVG